jgi:predicted CopG family antitoxin
MSSTKIHKKLKQIAIDQQNYDTLRMLGHTRDSFNDVLTRLLQQQNVKVLLLQAGSDKGQIATAEASTSTALVEE